MVSRYYKKALADGRDDYDALEHFPERRSIVNRSRWLRTWMSSIPIFVLRALPQFSLSLKKMDAAYD